MMWNKIQTMKAANMEMTVNEDEMMEPTEEGSDEMDAENLPSIEDDVPLVALNDPREQKRLLEALLFASPEPVSLKSMQNRLPDTAVVGGFLLELQDEYKQRGVNLVRLEDSWAFRTAQDVGPYLVLTKKEEKKLSRAALETLAVISYHQPVTRAEIENIRGVATNKGTLDVLLEAGWVKPGRRRETPGRPVTWITTTVFLDEFGISLLTDLPGLQEMKASGLLDTRPAIDTIPGASDLFASGEATMPIADGEASEGDEADDETQGEFDQASDMLEISEISDDEDLAERESA
ncbi:MAG: SMC-Scp complex subunit ScpB [Pseudomonadota bacterium]